MDDNSVELLKYVDRCVKCACCVEDSKSHLPICPSSRLPFLSNHPSGRLEVSGHVIRAGGAGALERDMLVKRIFSCTLCGACDYVCKTLTGRSPLMVFEEARRKLVQDGVAPPAAHVNLLKNVLELGNPQGVKGRKKLDRISGYLSSVDEHADLLYFIGCVASYSENLPMEAINMIRILEEAKVRFKVLADEPCCGSVLLRTGQERAVTDYMMRTYKMLEALDVKQVLFTCPGCLTTFRDLYPRLLGVDNKFKLVSSVEFVAGLLRKGRLSLKKIPAERRTVVTYHDPCHLGRQSGLYEEPREVLRALNSLKLVEMPRNRESSWCCGAGGGVKSAYPDLSISIGSERIDEALSVGAATLVSACPACESNLIDAAKSSPGGKRGKSINVVDLVDVVAASLPG